MSATPPPARRALTDQTGALPRLLGLGALMLLVLTAATLREPPPEPTPAPPPVPEHPPAPPPLPARPPPPERLLLNGLFPAFPRTTLIPMGRMEANGNPMEMGFFETQSPPGEVLEFYAREFRRRGRRVTHQPDGTGGGVVNYYDEIRGALVSVTAIGMGGMPPRTMVFPSLVDTPQGIHLHGSAPDTLPRPPGAMTVLRVDDRSARGPAANSMTLTEVAHGTPSMLAAFYREAFTGRGYSPAPARTGANGVELLAFERQGERLSLSLSPVAKDGPPESLVTVVQEWTTPSTESFP
ncbi:hypothetical protein [Myxococcus xanthus]|nr:hypothetical protein [Myxococcus xanthus]